MTRRPHAIPESEVQTSRPSIEGLIVGISLIIWFLCLACATGIAFRIGWNIAEKWLAR